MKHAILLLGIVLLTSSCVSPQSTARQMKSDHMKSDHMKLAKMINWKPVKAKKGTEIRVQMQDNCPVSVTDFYDASTVAACQNGNVVVSAAACRQAGDTVVWKAQGNGKFDIEFLSDTEPLTSHVDCKGTGGNFHCDGKVSSTAIVGKVYEYLVKSTSDSSCPSLDPYFIRYD